MAATPINKEQFQQMIDADKPLLVDFWAPWCGYCRRLSPADEEIAEEYGDRVQVTTVNIDEEGPLAASEGVEVIPTLILYRDGAAIASAVNPGTREAMDRFLRQALEG